MRKMQLKTSFIKSITDAVDKFVVFGGRCAGNTVQLQQVIKKKIGLQGSCGT